MARQPYLPHFSHLDFAVGSGVLDNRPELAACLGRCIAVWSYADNEMGHLLGILLETDAPVAQEVFGQLRRSAKQVEVLEIAARHKLVDRELELFNTIVRAYKYLENERNCLAHGCFGVASNDESVLFWLAVKDHVEFQTTVLSKMANGIDVEDPHEHLRKRMYVYKSSDLSGIEDDMKSFRKLAGQFNVYLRFKTVPSRSEKLAEMEKSPLVVRFKKA